DTLSYLVMGRPLNQTTASEGEDLSGVAMALGLAQATGVVNQIRTRMGLDELGAGTSAAQETTVVAGKQLGTKLYARYSYNTFTRLSALLLRYDLTRKLSLEATAGEAPGMDVIYRVGSDCPGRVRNQPSSSDARRSSSRRIMSAHSSSNAWSSRYSNSI